VRVGARGPTKTATCTAQQPRGYVAFGYQGHDPRQ
jgi:hypothetical protein